MHWTLVLISSYSRLFLVHFYTYLHLSTCKEWGLDVVCFKSTSLISLTCWFLPAYMPRHSSAAIKTVCLVFTWISSAWDFNPLHLLLTWLILIFTPFFSKCIVLLWIMNCVKIYIPSIILSPVPLEYSLFVFDKLA